MKKHLLTLALIPICFKLFAMPIYDADDRVLSVDATDEIRPYLSAVAASISQYMLEEGSDEELNISRIASKHKLVINGEDPRARLCDDEKFGELPVPASCSGFLVGPDLLLTAGHCVRDKYSCARNRWVFGFEAGKTSLPKADIYNCKQVLEQMENSGNRMDFALVQLDRPVKERKPLRLKSEGTVNCKEELMVAGHPYGLPLIYARDGYAQCDSIKKDIFYASLDSFAGNSGSPVINLQNGMVEGILVTGKEDYELDSKSHCYRPVKFTANLAGEGVVKLSSVYPYIKKHLK